MGRPDALKDVVESWKIKRDIEARKTQDRKSADSLRRFVELMNAQAKTLVREFEVYDPTFYEALAELATHAATVVAGAKVYADKVDRTNE